PPLSSMAIRLYHNKISLPVWVKVRAYKKVWVAKHRIASHTMLSAKDFVLEKHNIAGLKDKPLTQLSTKQWLKQSINKHHILCENQVSPIPSIIKGKPVHLTIRHHGIAIVT